MIRDKQILHATSTLAVLCLSTLPIASAHAQASFIYNNGYGETIDPTTGVVSGGTQYTYSNQVQNPYLTQTGSGAQQITNGRDLTEGTDPNSNQRIYTYFSVDQGSNISINTLSFDLYVRDPLITNSTTGASAPLYNPTTQDPFLSAHIAVYNKDPNNFDLTTSAGVTDAHSHLVGGDDTFTTNYLDTAITSFSGNYRYAPISAGGNGPTDTSRPIFNVGLNLNSLTLGTGQYYFVVSVNVDQNVASGQLAYAVIADATDPVNGQPIAGNGQNGIYSVSGNQYLTDQPQYNPNNNNPIILDAFPYTMVGTINDTMPEPGALALLSLGSLPIGAGILIKKRFRKRVG